MKSVRLLIVFLVAVAAWVVPGWASDRVALVIGNNDYESAERLYSPVNDANDMAATLRELGFDVIERTNLTRQAMDQVIEEFKLAIQPGGVGLFYFSGHGVQLEGANYLIPVDA
ncbi:MAG: caspase family protein, partial [Acidobacteriota bacterium]